jgi:hypothetical protein
MLVASDLKSLVLKRARAGRCSVFSSKVLLIFAAFLGKRTSVHARITAKSDHSLGSASG